VTTRILILEKFADIYAGELARQFAGIELHKAATAADIAVDLATIDVLVAFGIAIDDDLLARAKSLRWIASLATGVDHFLRCPSLKRDTILTSGRGIHGPAMRETVASLMLALARDTPRLVRNKADHRWDRGARWPLIAGKTAVVVGIGISGIAIGQLLKAFGMKVVGVSRTPRPVDGFDAMMPTERTTSGKNTQDVLPVATYSATPRIIAPMFSAAVDSNRSAPRPAQSPTLSPTRSATTAALRGSSSGIPASTLPTRSAPTSAALV